jgi:hypothetical protein
MSDESTPNGADDLTGAYLTETDQDVLRAWYERLLLLDPRYEDKRLRRIGARAMVDDEFRRQITGNAGSAGDENEPESPDTVNVRFFTNTPETLYVVLPPEAGAAENFPARLRDALRSRTSTHEALFADDWWDRDPDTRDHPRHDGTDTWDSSQTTLVVLEA